jgi:hypothetical protein
LPFQFLPSTEQTSFNASPFLPDEQDIFDFPHFLDLFPFEFCVAYLEGYQACPESIIFSLILLFQIFCRIKTENWLTFVLPQLFSLYKIQLVPFQ